MDIPEKRRAVIGMARRWQKDLDRLQTLFGVYDPENDFSNEVEIHRNLATAVAYAELFLSTVSGGG